MWLKGSFWVAVHPPSQCFQPCISSFSITPSILEIQIFRALANLPNWTILRASGDIALLPVPEVSDASSGVSDVPSVWCSFLGTMGIPGGTVVKNPPVNAGDARDVDSIPGLGRSLGGGNGDYGLRSLALWCVPHYSCPILLMMECQLFSSEPLLFLDVLKAKRLWKELSSLGSHARLHLHPIRFVKWSDGTGVSLASVPQGSVLTWSRWSVFSGAVNTAGAVYFHLIN